MNTSDHDTIAAVDLGSNSFHMVIARVDGDRAEPIEALKDRVRLAGGLDAHGSLTPESQERALVCLRDFGERLKGLPRGAVRAVGTSSLRKAHNRLPFLIRAHEALGHPIEVITGKQEACTIYRGVGTSLPEDTPNPRLVVDIGGGSTECVVGVGAEPLRAVSLDMGCVSYTGRFFKDGKVTAAGMDAAVAQAARTARPRKRHLQSLGWEACVGSSGTIRAVHRLIRQQGISEDITAESLAWLRRTMIEAGHVDELVLDGLSENRRPVIAGGLAVLSGVFQALELRRMSRSHAALREGILVEMLQGRHLSRYHPVAAHRSSVVHAPMYGP